MMNGPEGTVWEGAFLKAELKFPYDFPNKPPIMRFTSPGFFTRMYIKTEESVSLFC